MTRVVFRLRDGALHTSGHPLDRQERRLSDADWQAFDQWVATYHATGTTTDALNTLGGRIQQWLDGPERWIASLRRVGGGATIAEFAVDTQTDDRARSFLAVPWELLADDGQLLAADPGIQWAPVRRVGAEQERPGPRPDHRLGLMFMAAAPEGQHELDFEREEASILRATHNAGLDLFVEELGRLDDLKVGWSDIGNLDVLHLSCHGKGGAEPSLALETEAGTLDEVALPRMVAAFPGSAMPRLLFLSACHTGEGSPDVDSLARRLVGAGFPAVLGWADAVYDSDAAAFAATFYGMLARRHVSIEEAWATARFELLNRGEGRKAPRHWHLARLFLGPVGGGALSRGRAPRVRHDADQGRKRFLDARLNKIEVANRFEFVGRRREIQTILRAIRNGDHAGVLIHGFGRQGKSSLAARIVDRVGHEREPVVLYQRCEAVAVLKAIREVMAGVPEAARICDAFADQVDPNRPGGNPALIYDALRALFEGPCGYVGQGRPILLILDDFEALLDAPTDEGGWRVKADAVASLAAIIRAFDQGGTDSRLLITSRYTFPVSASDGRDLASRLLKVALPQMSDAAALRQARQKAFATFGAAAESKLRDNADLTTRAMKAARGNAGLQDILFRAAMVDQAAGLATIEALEAFLTEGDLPAAGELRDTLEKLAIDRLIAALTDGERELLRASTLSSAPIPIAVWREFAADAGYGAPDRLLAFGLWERVPDLVDASHEAAVRNALAGQRIGELDAAAATAVAAAVLPRLYKAWGGIAGARRSNVAPLQLALLAALAENVEVLEASAVDGIRALEAADLYRQGANFATNCIAALKQAERPLSPALLRAAAEMYDYVGDADGLRLIWAITEKVGVLEDDPDLSPEDRRSRAQLRQRHGGYLVLQGRPQEALRAAESARDAFEALGDQRSRAIAVGDIARIKTAQGEVDTALALHHEQLQIFDKLDDQRERAVTLSNIARIMAAKGELDTSLALHREQVQIFEALGERRERAVALGDIARILTTKGEVDAALALHYEELKVYEALDDRRSRAVTSGCIARILMARGEVDAALEMHRERLGVYEALGDRRSRAVTLGDIARILSERDDVDAALELHRERLQVYEALGDRRERAATLGDIARIMSDKGEVDAALLLHQERLAAYEALGDRRGRAIALGDIANIVVARGEVARFLEIKKEELATYRDLSDQHSLCITHGEIGQFHLSQAIERHDVEAFRLALDHLSESYAIANGLGHVSAIAESGALLVQALMLSGSDNDLIRPIAERARAAFLKLGQQAAAARLDGWLKQLG